MIRRKQVVALLASGALSLSAVFAANVGASPSGGLNLTSVPSANTRSDGYAPASKLSPELTQTAVAQGSTRMENSSALTSFYGYDNDVLNSAGTHFLFQGHESGVGGAADITRINLDADAEYRVTLLATTDVNGNPIAPIDGSTWDPWAKRLLLTTENTGAPTYAATPNFPSAVTDVSGALGRGARKRSTAPTSWRCTPTARRSKPAG